MRSLHQGSLSLPEHAFLTNTEPRKMHPCRREEEHSSSFGASSFRERAIAFALHPNAVQNFYVTRPSQPRRDHAATTASTQPFGTVVSSPPVASADAHSSGGVSSAMHVDLACSAPRAAERMPRHVHLASTDELVSAAAADVKPSPTRPAYAPARPARQHQSLQRLPSQRRCSCVYSAPAVLCIVGEQRPLHKLYQR